MRGLERSERLEGARRRRRSLLRDTGGAAMTEAVIMLPVLIVIWGIVLYIHFGFRDAQRNMATLRDHAWSHAYTGCNTTAPSPTILEEGMEFDGETSGGISGLGSALRWVANNLFFIDEFGGRRDVSIARPESLGGGSRTLRWELLLVCNEDQRGDDETPWYEALFDFFSGA